MAVSQVATHALSVAFDESGKAVIIRTIGILRAVGEIGTTGKIDTIAITDSCRSGYEDFSGSAGLMDWQGFVDGNGCDV